MDRTPEAPTGWIAFGPGRAHFQEPQAQRIHIEGIYNTIEVGIAGIHALSDDIHEDEITPSTSKNPPTLSYRFFS